MKYKFEHQENFTIDGVTWSVFIFYSTRMLRTIVPCDIQFLDYILDFDPNHYLNN